MYPSPLPARRTRNALGSLCVASFLLPIAPPAFAADHWLSGVRTPDGKSLDASTISASSGLAVFDVVISLEANPQGDDEWPADDGATDDAQQVFEAKIEKFADAIFQSTNGAHKLGKVTIYRSFNQQSQADILWTENCSINLGPRANPNGFDRDGMHIWTCTNWAGATGIIETPAGQGAVLAHEWGHYAYGLFDEYQDAQCTNLFGLNCGGVPKGTDTAVSPSIMNCQWFAVGGSCTATSYSGAATDFFEFSTPNLAPYSAGSTGDTAHKRVFGESGWSTLSRSTASDPFFHFLFKAERTHYTNLSAPVSPNFIVRDSEASARSDLDIRWAGDAVVELMIDRSGSMSGAPIANAQIASSLLVDLLVPGENAIGVGSFSSSPGQDFPITDIPDPDTGVKAGARAAIAALNASGGTDVNSGLTTALSQVVSFDPNRNAVVYLLSDGVGGTDNRQGIIDGYRAAGVPIVAFAYGDSADEVAMRDYANQTGGQFVQSPTTLAQIQAAFVAANAAFSSSVVVASGSAAAAASSTSVRNVVLDSTLATTNINVSFDGSASEIGLNLLRPNGSNTGQSFTCTGTSAQSCGIELSAAFFAANGFGTYGVEVTNTTGAEKSVAVLVSGTPAAGAPYNVVLDFDNAAYPEPMLVRATVRKDVAISGLTVTGVLSLPDGTSLDIALQDSGAGADNIADDGTYSASIPYATDGNYNLTVNVSNAAGQAQTTFNGVALGVGLDGRSSDPVPEPVTENFTRSSSATAVVSGFAADDHGNDVAAGCTAITDTNVATAGRIDTAGDVDCFTFTPTSTTAALVVRATGLTGGLDPVVSVRNSTGTTELARVTLATSQSPQSGAIITVPASALSSAGHVVTVASSLATAAGVTYSISAGPALLSDVVEVGTGPSPTGGALDVWSLLVLALLGLAGLFRLRRAI